MPFSRLWNACSSPLPPSGSARRKPDDRRSQLPVAPVYYHNYLLGHLIAAQLRHYLEANFAGTPLSENELLGRYLQ